MTKKEKKLLFYGGGVLLGVGVLATIVIVANSGKKGNISLKVADKNPSPSPNTQTNPAYTSGGGYTPPKPTQNAWRFNQNDTIIVQKYLYTYYPATIKRVGDIGTNGKPDGAWGNNTQRAVDSVVANYGWTSEQQLVEYAKAGSYPYRNEIYGLFGIQQENKGIELLL
jgi:hypothetical protein